MTASAFPTSASASQVPKRSAWTSVFAHPSFSGAFHQGLGAVVGAIAGLMIWISAQPLPVVPDYKQIAYLAGHDPATKVPAVPDLKTSTTPKETKETPAKKAPEAKGAPHGAHSPAPEKITTPAAATAITEPKPEQPTEVATPKPHPERTIPDPTLVADTPPYGPLPIIGKDGKRPFDTYRHKVSPDVLKKPLIAIAVLDFGLSGKQSENALASLPTDVSFVLSTTPADAAEWARKATHHGHEIWAELVMEPQGYPDNDPGMYALMTASSVDQNHNALMHQMGRGVGYVGFIAPTFGPYIKSGADLGAVRDKILSRGLGLVVNGQDTPAQLNGDLRQQKPPYFFGSLTHVATPADAPDVFANAERQAGKSGFAIVTFTPLPGTTKAVQNWIVRLQQSGFGLAPLSVIAERGVDLMGAP